MAETRIQYSVSVLLEEVIYDDDDNRIDSTQIDDREVRTFQTEADAIEFMKKLTQQGGELR